MKFEKAKTKIQSMKMPASKSNLEEIDATDATTDALEPEAGGGGTQGEDGNGLNHISDDELIAEIKSRGLSSSADKPKALKNMEADRDEKSKKVSAK